MQKYFGAKISQKLPEKLVESGAKIRQKLVESEAKIRQFGSYNILINFNDRHRNLNYIR